MPDLALKPAADDPSSRLLWEGAHWDFALLSRAYDAIEEIALGRFGLSVYPNQIEVITSEQMLDAYASTGLPVMYRHWSFGKHFARDEALYRRGHQGLAYEIVINSSPCISYVMEENSMTMQALVMAHAAFGHNHFFRNNYLFRDDTDAAGILNYLAFARDYVARCEERHGIAAVERVLDAAHALQPLGIDRRPHRRGMRNLADEERREAERRAHEEATYNDLWRTTVPAAGPGRAREAADRRRAMLNLPEENVLYFLEKYAPKLRPWERELIRIVRNLAQYFHPQRQTKVINEGCATHVHYEMFNALHAEGRISDGSMLEFLASHSGVVFQPDYRDPRFGGINPYALGFGMMQDVARICTAPSEEDRRLFPDFAGNGDPWGTLRHGWANFRDESFILQFLSPALVRRMRLFQLRDDSSSQFYQVGAIQDERGWKEVRRLLAQSYDPGRDPDIQVVDVDLDDDRHLRLEHKVADGRYLDPETLAPTLSHLADLWGYRVTLVETGGTGAPREYSERGR